VAGAYTTSSEYIPRARNDGLARTLYERFFQIARADDRQTVTAIMAPTNQTSIAFHRRMGFAVAGPIPDYNGGCNGVNRPQMFV